MGKLIASHPDYHAIEVEARFHTARGGLCEVLNGEATVDDLRDRCLNKWWQRGLRLHRGLMLIVEREELVAALDRFEEALGDDPLQAARDLVEAVFAPSLERNSKPAWVEVSGSNIMSGPTLARIFPNARFILMMRDGRSVTTAIVRKRDMPDDPADALDHWSARMLKSFGAAKDIPKEAFHIIHLEDLVHARRDETLHGLCEFLGLEETAPVEEYFERTISAERAHIGGWRERVAPADARWIERNYRRAVRDLEKRGVTWFSERD